jgi:two-component system chemotaxis response regulator CheB
MTGERKIRVLVVDDSASMRQVLTSILSSDAQIEVVGAASDPFVARDQIKLLNPDVLTLDIEMPRMDGLDFLRNLMRLRPLPVVMCSSMTESGAAATLDALSLGAVDFVSKPSLDAAHGLVRCADEIIAKVKAASKARVRALDPTTIVARRSSSSLLTHTSDQVIAIGASTGGVEAIREVLSRLPPDAPGVVIAQHIPKAFSGPFARRMNSHCDLRVAEAADGQPILAGHVYIAPGDQHLEVLKDGAHYRCRLSAAPPVNRHRPSVDVLFGSMARNVGRNAVGALLTGMGRDGAEGMKAMRDAGAVNIVQDERSSVVWGMPGAAWVLGAAEAAVPLEGIASRLMQALRCRT